MVQVRDLEQELQAIVRATPWLLDALARVRHVAPAGALIAAGAVRDTVWNVLGGRDAPPPAADVDVVYWQASEEPERARYHQDALARVAPTLCWEVTNQAWVHLWYSASGSAVAALGSVEEGLSTWPETATAVGVRLSAHDTIEVVAPLGLEDLFARLVRHNPARASAAVYAQRLAEKNWLRRFPELQILPSRELPP